MSNAEDAYLCRVQGAWVVFWLIYFLCGVLGNSALHLALKMMASLLSPALPRGLLAQLRWLT